MGRLAQRKKRRRKKVFWFLVFPILLIAIVSTGYGAYLYKKAEVIMSNAFFDDRGKSDLRDKRVDPNFDNVSVLFIGVDTSEKRGNDENGRSDALMLATLNKDEKSVKLLSIPRDSRVYVPEVGYETKINHAHSHGGPRATIETVENLLEIPVDYYVRLDFEAFMEVVDALGGIDVDVPYTFSEQDSKDRPNAITLEAGLQRLNGEEALALARTRKLDNDIERGKRQQEIMKAILKRAASGTSVVKYGDVIEAIGSNMKTNMTFDEMKAFIDYGISGNLVVETLNLEGNDLRLPNSRGLNVYYWQLDNLALAELKTDLKTHLELTTSSPTEMASEHTEE
ncbi:LCP family protein [Pueribacillus sp. YX66]|uniref:LCP family protein n=1 Tax=Pueribacillus sp. YX66 TaxID=3229242 RepID=UPI00358D5391